MSLFAWITIWVYTFEYKTKTVKPLIEKYISNANIGKLWLIIEYIICMYIFYNVTCNSEHTNLIIVASLLLMYKHAFPNLKEK